MVRGVELQAGVAAMDFHSYAGPRAGHPRALSEPIGGRRICIVNNKALVKPPAGA